MIAHSFDNIRQEEVTYGSIIKGRWYAKADWRRLQPSRDRNRSASRLLEGFVKRAFLVADATCVCLALLCSVLAL